MIVYNDFIKGRLGNQLFFVASTMGIAKKNNTDYYFTNNLGNAGLNYQLIFKNNLPLTTYLPEKKYFQEKFCFYDIEINEDVELIGYFQSEKFFENVKNEVRKQFEFKDECVEFVNKKYLKSQKNCSLHIRRGDFILQPNHHPTTSLSYYNYLLDQYQNDYEQILIFSDDIDWAKENFKNKKFVFPEFEKTHDLYSFILMTLCDDNIICNSTFSWWAAYLNKNQNKKVFAPAYKKWFGPGYSNLDTKDIIPENFIQINYD